jgi:osmoprotectant transport system permease protein
MKKFFLVFGVCVLLLGASCNSGKGKTIVVGAKDFTEQDILGNMLNFLITEHTDYKVDYKHEISSSILWAAIKSGDVDLSIDYTGTMYAHVLKGTETHDPQEVYEIAKKGLKDEYRILMLNPLGFNNTYTLSVRPETAEKYGLKTYSDLAKVSHELILGGTFEIFNRNDGIPNLKKTYNMSFKDEKAIDGILRYAAINNNEIDITTAFSTDGMLIEHNLTVLEDDKNFFPPYHAVPLIREDSAKKFPEIIPLMEKLHNLFTDASMRDLNYQVEVLKRNHAEVAKEFLIAQGLISN